MKAFVCEQYGPPEKMRMLEVPRPTPGPDEVLVKVYRTALNAADWRLLVGDPFLVRLMMGLFRPKYKILGADFSGVIDAVGAKVKQFQPGDEVFGDVANYRWGAFGEYLCSTESFLAPKPPSMSFDDAAAIPMAGLTALQGLRDLGELKPGEKVAVNGASGGVGTFAVQVAKLLGAEVTAVCSSMKVEMAKELGADDVIDYQKEDFTCRAGGYDVIFAANGYHPLADYKRALKPGGRYVVAGGTNRQFFETMALGQLSFRRSGKKIALFSAKTNREDLLILADWCASGKLKPMIDRTFSFDEIPGAMRYVMDGHAKGKVIIEMAKV